MLTVNKERLTPFAILSNLDLYLSVIYVQSLSTKAATPRCELRHDKWRFKRNLATAENSGARIVTALMCPCVFI
jgi:hypothetical protein